MKAIFLFVTITVSTSMLKAQTLEDAKKQVYYEHYDDAKALLKKLTEQPEATPAAWYWLGEIYLEEGKLDSAQSSLQQGSDFAVKRQLARKEHPLVFIGWAHVLMDKGDSVGARQQFETILNETKYKNALVLWGVARANIDSKHGNKEWAMELLEKAAARDRKNPEIYMAIGDLHRQRIEGGPAITAYNKALSLDPKLAEAYYKQGKIYKSQNNTGVYLDLFEKATQTDSAYSPAFYELYNHYFYFDPAKARPYLEAYIRHSEYSPEHDYMRADLEYISKNYASAVALANNIIQRDGDSAAPRLYKLMAYSNEALGDSALAFENVTRYFEKNDTAKNLAKDYELHGRLLLAVKKDTAQAMNWYRKAWEEGTDAQEKIGYLLLLADLAKKSGDRQQEAEWRGYIYRDKPQTSNIDLYNWGLALFASGNYQKSDSVFAIYAEKYPEQVYGYLWRAKSNALIDTAMEQGLAVPHYKKLVEVAAVDSVKNRSLLVSAYGYLGSYEANITKDFPASLAYFERLLLLDPANNDATRYAATLRKWIEDADKTQSN